MKRLFPLLIVTVAFATDASARALDAAEALQRALPASTASVSCKSANHHELAYTAGHNSLYVFNRSSGGYIVVSGDDNAEALLAEIPAGFFRADNMPPAAEAWLSEYARQIQWLRANHGQTETAMQVDREEENGMMRTESLPDLYANWKAIPPVMSCKYNQTDPYNRKCPSHGGTHCVTGCAPTAMAQVVRTIGYQNGSGTKRNNTGDESVYFDFANTRLDFAGMPDIITDTSPQEHIDAVAELMMACGLSAEASYGVDKTPASSQYVAFGLVDNFGFDDRYTRYISRSNMTAADWAKTIYSELEAGRPVYYDGSNNTMAHAFVIDGYAPDGFWHVNWGWGGMSDGYFRLSAMYPISQGTGGSYSHYNWLQYLIKAVPPGADPGYVYPDLGGSITMVGDGVYSVYYQSIGRLNSDITIGAVITDSDNRQVAQFGFWEHQSIVTTGQLRKDNLEFDFTRAGLRPGSYRIYPAFGKSGSDHMEITGRYPDRQHFIYLTVTSAGEYIFSNNPVSGPKEGFDLLIAGISADTRLLSGFTSTLSMTVVNNGRSDYFANSYVAIMNPADNSILSQVSALWVNVPAAGNETISVQFSMKADDGSDIAPGEYSVVLINKKSGTAITPPATVTVTGGHPPNTWQEPTDFAVTNGSTIPAVLYKGDPWPHTPEVKSRITSEIFLYARFYIPASTWSLNSVLLYNGRPGIMSGQLTVNHPAIDIDFGIYDVSYTKTKTISSEPRRVRVGAEIDGIYYLPLNDKEAEVAQHPDQGYSGTIDIPEKITVDGTTYTVTTIGADAFNGSHGIETVIVPATVTNIMHNAFAYCGSIRNILFKTDGIPFRHRNFVAPGLNPDACIYVKADRYEQDSGILSDYHRVYATIEHVESKDAVLDGTTLTVSLAITPAHEATDPGFSIEPADSWASDVADISIASVRPGAIDLAVKPHMTAEADYRIISSQPSVEPALLHLNVMAVTGLDHINAIGNDSTTGIYDLSGRRIRASDVRPGQLIILITTGGTRKITADNPMHAE